ncbi:MAG: hypothetical protein A3F92_05725 [Candidatus Rokubacteria bacterium RIFCSPLOWO2_12_FULL_71_22]|nr:MAG: hypothetical protein A3F92_05725 [Candidatus Rokubacteria bacterium RIFCSPLOWO2_12_FULL_71_22]
MREPVPRDRLLLWLVAAVLLIVTPAVAHAQRRDATAAVETATRFLLGWGHRRDADWARAATRAVVVRIGQAQWTLRGDEPVPAVVLVFPFVGLRPVWVGADVKGVTVRSLCLSVGGRVHCGRGTVTLTRLENAYRVTAVSLAAGASRP